MKELSIFGLLFSLCFLLVYGLISLKGLGLHDMLDAFNFGLIGLVKLDFILIFLFIFYFVTVIVLKLRK